MVTLPSLATESSRRLPYTVNGPPYQGLTMCGISYVKACGWFALLRLQASHNNLKLCAAPPQLRAGVGVRAHRQGVYLPMFS